MVNRFIGINIQFVWKIRLLPWNFYVYGVKIEFFISLPDGPGNNCSPLFSKEWSLMRFAKSEILHRLSGKGRVRFSKIWIVKNDFAGTFHFSLFNMWLFTFRYIPHKWLKNVLKNFVLSKERSELCEREGNLEMV